MKNLFLSLVIVLTSLVVNGQIEYYFPPNVTSSYVLDSLDIPYLPMTERTQKSLILHGCTEISINEFNSFFNNGEFVYIPDLSTPKISLSFLMGGTQFLTESDEFMINFLILLETQSVGFADVQIKDSKYSMVRIIETVSINDTFSTIVLLQTHDGKWDYVDENIDRTGTDYIVTYK
jgi:hypothetical protein